MPRSGKKFGETRATLMRSARSGPDKVAVAGSMTAMSSKLRPRTPGFDHRIRRPASDVLPGCAYADHRQPIRRIERERPKQHGVHDAEHRRRGADAKGQRHHGHNREGGRRDHLARAEPDVTLQLVEPVHRRIATLSGQSKCDTKDMRREGASRIDADVSRPVTGTRRPTADAVQLPISATNSSRNGTWPGSSRRRASSISNQGGRSISGALVPAGAPGPFHLKRIAAHRRGS